MLQRMLVTTELNEIGTTNNNSNNENCNAASYVPVCLS